MLKRYFLVKGDKGLTKQFYYVVKVLSLFCTLSNKGRREKVVVVVRRLWTPL